MIEALVAHIQERGFTVHIFPHMLRIFKMVGEQRCEMDWMISQIDLMYLYCSEILFQQADGYMDQIDVAISGQERKVTL